MFWDSSAIVPLLVTEPRSQAIERLLSGDDQPVVWWATPVECQSALRRRHRESPWPSAQLAAATERLRVVAQHVDTVAPSDELRSRAGRLLASHPLRAADALQLAAALLWCEEQPHGEGFVTLDERLADAAANEGFTVHHPGAAR
jgi:predicted nucleic acid-binding protein